FAGVLQDGSGTLALTKTGNGTQTLSGANTYSGLTAISQGAVTIQSNTALGAATAGTTVSSGAALQLQGPALTTVNEPLTLNGSGLSNTGALRALSGTPAWAGPVTLNSDSSIGVDTGATLKISGALSGPASLTKAGGGTLILTNPSNSYGGDTTISGGTLQLGAAGVIPDSSSVTVAAGAA